MSNSRFHSLRTWFLLAVAWVVFAFLITMVFQIEFLGVAALLIAGWFFVVWTVGVGVRVGVGR